MIRYVGFPAAESSYINEANWYRDMFENALREAGILILGAVFYSLFFVMNMMQKRCM